MLQLTYIYFNIYYSFTLKIYMYIYKVGKCQSKFSRCFC